MSYADFAYFYDQLTGNVDYETRFNYIKNLLAENDISKGILLDLACGTGTLTQMFCDAGFDMIGVDFSEDMLSIAQEKKMQSGSDIIYLCQDMTELDLFGTINACICTLDSLNHIIDENELEKVFKKVSLFMEDEGIFIFDVNTPYKHEQILGDNTFVYDLDDVFCVWQNSLSKSDLVTTISLDIFAKDDEDDLDDDEESIYVRYSESFCERGYQLETFEKLAQQNKFEVLAVYDELSKETANEKSQRVYFVCKKHGLQ